MEATTALQDEQFLKWILSKEAEQYWALDRQGKRIKLKEGWGKAQAEFERIVGNEKDLKVCEPTYGIE
jgi:hypothetical protein